MARGAHQVTMEAMVAGKGADLADVVVVATRGRVVVFQVLEAIVVETEARGG